MNTVEQNMLRDEEFQPSDTEQTNFSTYAGKNHFVSLIYHFHIMFFKVENIFTIYRASVWSQFLGKLPIYSIYV